MRYQRRVIVAAHPDDEILWLSAYLEAAGKVVVCFGAPFGKPDMAARRQRTLNALNLPNLVQLSIEEAGVRKLVDWANPQPTETGMAILDPLAEARYDANFDTPGSHAAAVTGGCLGCLHA